MSKYVEVLDNEFKTEVHTYKKGRPGFEYANSWKEVTDRDLTGLWRSCVYQGPVEPNWHSGGLTFGVVVDGEITMETSFGKQVFQKGDMILDHNVNHTWHVSDYAHVVFLIYPKES